MNQSRPTIAILGTSGLVGCELVTHLLRRGFPVVAIARRFTAAQKTKFKDHAVECPLVALEAEALRAMLAGRNVDIIVNCLGILQDGSRGSTEDVHAGFVARLLKALNGLKKPALLVQISIPGNSDHDRTAFSRTKRQAETLIASEKVPYVIIRPGFVIAATAYGGSALIRALAASPFMLASSEAKKPFAATSIEHIGRTLEFVAEQWTLGQREWAVSWDVMERQPSSVGAVVEAFRRNFGGPRSRLRLPSSLMTFGAKLGDLAAYFGWAPPIRTTALLELRRGVTGNPDEWIEATGIAPASLEKILSSMQATIQERWFARLYLLKEIVIGGLVLFWTASGFIALTMAFKPASAILTAHGFPEILADSITIATSLADISVGCLIALRKTCHTGLWAGIGLSTFHMVSAAIITPELWVEPLGALVKTGPAIVLMLVALAILDDR